MTKKIFLATTIMLSMGIVTGCGLQTEVSNDTIVQSSHDDESRMPPVPTAQELTEVMNTFDSYKEYQGKLLEVGLDEPVHVLKEMALSGNGVSDFVADIYFYEASDGYFALYAQGDAIVKDLPESIVKNIWTPEEMASYLTSKNPN